MRTPRPRLFGALLAASCLLPSCFMQVGARDGSPFGQLANRGGSPGGGTSSSSSGGGSTGSTGATSSPSLNLSVSHGATAYYGDCLPVTITLSQMPAGVTSGTLTVTPSATFTGSGVAPVTTPIALFGSASDCHDGATSPPAVTMAISNQSGSATFYTEAYNGDGPLSLALAATLVTSSATYRTNTSLTLQPRAGFMMNGTVFSATPTVSSTAHSWKGSIQTISGKQIAVLTNSPADPNGTLSIAKNGWNYTVASAYGVVNNALPSPAVVVGASGLNVAAALKSRVVGYGASASAPVKVTNSAAQSYVNASYVQAVRIDAPGYYTFCPTASGAPLAITVSSTFNNNAGSGQELSIYTANGDYTLAQEDPNTPLNVSDFYVSGSGSASIGGINVNGNINIGGGLSPNHPTDGCN